MCPRITESSRKRKREYQKKKSSDERAHLSGIWYLQVNRVHKDVIVHLKPIGAVGNEKFTISIDTEGCGISNEIGSIHVSGWCSRNLRIQTIYYAEVQLEHVPNPATWISGLQQQD